MNCPHCGMKLEFKERIGFLTPRQREIAELLATTTEPYKLLGNRLNLNNQCIKNAATRIFHRLGVKSRLELMTLWPTEVFQTGIHAPRVQVKEETL